MAPDPGVKRNLAWRVRRGERASRRSVTGLAAAVARIQIGSNEDERYGKHRSNRLAVERRRLEPPVLDCLERRLRQRRNVPRHAHALDLTARVQMHLQHHRAERH